MSKSEKSKNSLVINEKKYFQMDVDCRTCKTLKDLSLYILPQPIQKCFKSRT